MNKYITLGLLVFILVFVTFVVDLSTAYTISGEANSAVATPTGFEEVDVWTPAGEPITLLRPHVVHERCIGCGICENNCPLGGQAAIRVYTPTELGVALPW